MEDTAPGGHGPQLKFANHTPIRPYGTKTADPCFGDQRFKWDFVTADISFPLLGADFLCAHYLLVGVINNRLVDAQTFSLFPCARGEAAYGGLSSSLRGGRISTLFRLFPGLTRPTFSAVMAKHGVEHHIDTKGPGSANTVRSTGNSLDSGWRSATSFPPGRPRVCGFRGPQATNILHVQGGGTVVRPPDRKSVV